MAVTPKITIQRDDSATAAALAAAALAQEPGTASDGGRAARRKLLEKARAEAAVGNFAGDGPKPSSEPADDPNPREPIDSLTFKLPNGCIVEFGPPVGVSLTAKMLQFYGAREWSSADERVTWAMCCLRKVDEQTVSILNSIDRDRWLNVVGDDGIGVLMFVLNKYWPPVRKYDLQIIQKKMR